MQPVIRIADVWKYYDGDGSSTAALRGTNLEVAPGKLVAIYGQSGSGKSTLLNVLAGLDRVSKGVIEVEGNNIEALGELGRTMLRRTRIGFVFQFFNLLPTLTAFENIYLSLELAGRTDEQAVQGSLKAVGLEGKGKRFPHELSGGEQQRVAIARALVKQPSIILADEPTGNLDSQIGNQILDLLSRTCRERKTTLIVATHSPLTCRYVDRTMRMVDGVLEEDHSCPEPDA
ncbi:MAG: ABC transporter ATP-binding protein [Proteobacteria bacterium]|nr:ABC transporter ATP-binding protein [Pseudomonadota bacterium]